MPALITSDMWRDGGSLSAVVDDGDKKLSFWLETNRWNHPRERGHVHLYVSHGEFPERKEQKVEISSLEESQWLEYLLKIDDSRATAGSQEIFRKLIGVVQARHNK